MLDTVAITLSGWIEHAGIMAFIGSFIWGGVAVFFSPCHLASIPLIIAYVGGQGIILQPRQAAAYSLLFTLGIFITILLVGFSCTLAGRMLGDIGSIWLLPVGLLFIWIGWGMLQTGRQCGTGGSLLQRIRLRGLPGALILGLAFGLATGVCSFAFLAPILGVITIQGKTTTGLIMITLFALGHCLPIMAAGTGSALLKNFLAHHAWQKAVHWFRRGAGLILIALGLYFIITSFL